LLIGHHRQSMSLMLRFSRRSALAAIGFCLALCLGAGPAGADSEADASKVIDSFHDTLMSVMKDATKLGYDGRYKKLEPAIERTFNVPLMTQIVVGAPWSGWSQDQRDKVVEAFGKFITATYARRFDGYSGENFVIDGTHPTTGGVLVKTRIVRTTDTPITLNYLTRDNGQGGYMVVDVFLTGTISELATRRSEFGAVLQHDGYQGLLTALAQKASSQSDQKN
jgi:phospholipid transport system substrate-binding protein